VECHSVYDFESDMPQEEGKGADDKKREKEKEGVLGEWL